MNKKGEPKRDCEAWGSTLFLAKAQRYFEEMLAVPRDDWKFGFWSSLALEQLARSVLAAVSPALLADATNWNNLYYALGYAPTAKKFSPKSISTQEVFLRLKEIYPAFDSQLEGFCLAHAGRRNAELHSAETPFDEMRNSDWLPIFYRACRFFTDQLGLKLSDLLGKEEARTARKLIGALMDDSAKAVAGTIKAHNTVWTEKPAQEKRDLLEQAKVWASRHSGHRVACPACGSPALVVGDPISAPKTSIKDDVITEKQQYLPSKFECQACALKIAGLPQLSASGLGDAFTQTSTYNAAEYYAPSEVDSAVFDDDNNEPY